MNKCPICKKESVKAIYYGLPVKFCMDEECNCMFGFWTFITNLLPFNGWVFTYKSGYLKALYQWLFS